MIFQTKAQGKLLLTGEYAVLDGALALAVPVRFGQSFAVEAGMAGQLHWQAFDDKNTCWLDVQYGLEDFELLASNDQDAAVALQGILRACRKQNAAFLNENTGFRVETRLDFPRDWGLGSSSTLIAALSAWAKINPYVLLADTFGGSGYDLACAFASGPILYQWAGGVPVAKPVLFNPPFAQQMGFVYLGKKQNSREGIRHYREMAAGKEMLAIQISECTYDVLMSDTHYELMEALEKHENLIASALKLEKVKDLYFADFPGAVKSLGAWGGDFVWAVADMTQEEMRQYFNEKGFEVFIPFVRMMNDEF